MTLNELLHRANTVYAYSESDKVILRALAKEDPLGLMLALESDPLLQEIRVEPFDVAAIGANHVHEG